MDDAGPYQQKRPRPAPPIEPHDTKVEADLQGALVAAVKLLQKAGYNDHWENFCFMFEEDRSKQTINDPFLKKTDFLLRFLHDVEEEASNTKWGADERTDADVNRETDANMQTDEVATMGSPRHDSSTLELSRCARITIPSEADPIPKLHHVTVPHYKKLSEDMKRHFGGHEACRRSELYVVIQESCFFSNVGAAP